MLSYTFPSPALCLPSLVSPLSMRTWVCLDHSGQVSEGLFVFPFADLVDVMAYFHLQNPNPSAPPPTCYLSGSV